LPNPKYINQKETIYPILTTITKYPGSVSPSNKPKIQKHIEPADNRMKFLRITPEDCSALYKKPNPKNIKTGNNNPPIMIPARLRRFTL